MKKYLITGLIILLPSVFTLIILIWMIDLLTDPFSGMIQRLILAYEGSQGIYLHNHEFLITLVSRVVVLLALFLFLLILGFIGHRFFFHQLIALSHKIFTKIPIVKTIYRISSDVTHAFLKQDSSFFKGTVLVPFPMDQTHALGLITGEIPKALKKHMETLDLSVFIPTAPHPTSGYLLLTPKESIIPIDMSTEETFRFLISCGAVVPPPPQK